MVPTLYLDPQSPYAYLAASRAPQVLGVEPDLQPVALGVLFARRGLGSWAHTEARDEHVAEVERRAAAYGLPPVTWPASWPAQSLDPVRAATWARMASPALGATFLHSLWRRVFAEGQDPADRAVLRAAAEDAGLDPAELGSGLADPSVKDALKAATDEAWALGVTMVPTLRIGDRLHVGDDHLEEAAATLRDPA